MNKIIKKHNFYHIYPKNDNFAAPLAIANIGHNKLTGAVLPIDLLVITKDMLENHSEEGSAVFAIEYINNAISCLTTPETVIEEYT